MTEDKSTRIEKDSMGPMEVPADAYYGASTMRAVLNFPISDLRFPRSFIQALGLIKLAAAEVNCELGLLEPDKRDGIVQAAKEVVNGELDEHFVLDVFQTGSGTSTNMNANEVIANRASEIMGGGIGSRVVHPNDHVNKGQSSNDVIPTTMHLAALTEIETKLIPALERTQAALEGKSREFWDIIKTGRTHLQDATPVRLGQEFLGYASQIKLGIGRLAHAREELSQVALGGTAVGTGVNTHPEFADRVTARVSELGGVAIRETEHHFQAQNALDGVVEASAVLRTIAISMTKIANDIRWMGSGPRAGIGELALPEVQPGSSIMPGKVNPVIPESVIQVCAQVKGNDATIASAGQDGYFEINLMMPVAAYNLLQSVSILAAAADNFTNQCINGLQATDQGPNTVERGLMIGTALAPVIGYDLSARIAKEAAKSNRSIREVARELTDLPEEELSRILDPETMVEPRA